MAMVMATATDMATARPRMPGPKLRDVRHSQLRGPPPAHKMTFKLLRLSQAATRASGKKP